MYWKVSKKELLRNTATLFQNQSSWFILILVCFDISKVSKKSWSVILKSFKSLKCILMIKNVFATKEEKVKQQRRNVSYLFTLVMYIHSLLSVLFCLFCLLEVDYFSMYRIHLPVRWCLWPKYNSYEVRTMMVSNFFTATNLYQKNELFEVSASDWPPIMYFL